MLSLRYDNKSQSFNKIIDKTVLVYQKKGMYSYHYKKENERLSFEKYSQLRL